MSKRGEYFYALDLVRFSAALMVVFYHLGWSTWSLPTSLGASLVGGVYQLPEMEAFAWWGAVGVQIFFVISGFVIANSANGATPIQFLRSRLERLYPAVWIIAPITALVWVASGAMGAGEIIERLARSITLAPMGPWIDGVYWTLPCEIFFYALVFVLLCFGGFRKLEIFAIALASASGIFNILYLLNAFELVELEWVHLFAEGSLKPLLPYYGILFALGVLAWLDRQNLLSRAGRATAVGATLVCLAQISEWGMQLNETSWLVPVLVWSFAILIVRYSRWSPPLGFQRGVRTIGLITYPLYLIHFTVGCFLMRQLVLVGNFSPLLALFFTILILICASWFVTSLIEPAVRRTLRTALQRLEKWVLKPSALSFLNRQAGNLI